MTVGVTNKQHILKLESPDALSPAKKGKAIDTRPLLLYVYGFETPSIK